ncbi:lysoplasmalogenase [Corythoichthys intestinalis]|uniref:lysoplasmalogenase n=1 Tax=Corythoichthys intestinalis TaxID=161448 RepID=UPI0025A521DE|nr:lysoplasmalogenase [Corythoichthys intestinalis]XP_061804922.1 lysoplasmalogenase TMEM86B-like [Nerophis lumbriciformis]
MDILETDAYDRRQRRNTSCALLLSLAPFFLASAVYFYLVHLESPASIVRAGVKSAPTFLLAAAVLSWNGCHSVLGVAGGLVFSAVGDICLVWPELFLHGMAAFALAHLLYSVTFLSSRYETYSSSSCTGPLYLILMVTAAGIYAYLFPFLKKDPSSEILVPAVGVYIALITMMAILAIRTRRGFTLLGSLFFIMSDMALALQVFKVTAPVAHGHTVVMVTYYLAQLLISVGDMRAVERKNDFAKWKRS